MTKERSAFIYGADAYPYKFSDTHPFHPLRLQLTHSLLESIGALKGVDIISPERATDEQLAYIHDPNFIEAVKEGGKGSLDTVKAQTFGLGTEDTPVFPHMHEASSYLVGGTIAACDAVLRDGYEHAFHLGGGLHHGFRGRASGFCVYNDSSIAIEYMRRKYGARVLYVDTDAHHGDGVQWAFYEDSDVCTLSIHETGRYLFPGTGHVTEKGSGEGYGYSINIPLDAFTEDDSFLYAYRKALKEAVTFFRPDIILTQNGADAHYYDPLSHLHLSIQSFREIPTIVHELAHEYCDGRWVAIGGGGYDKWRVVPRAWSYIWLAMTDQLHLAKERIPASWLQQWQKEAAEILPSTWSDPSFPVIPRKTEITEKNRLTVDKALYHIRREQEKK
ncbi:MULTISPECIES: acetoin utilization protein AcuC [Bacillaceae]|uniref:Acetoin utilization protein AcuC n=1 Tax=Alkalicoccobacillus plakortidis TaxID=444060 RepID=A0A9D5I275_9BACI|nr:MULTISPECIES: acetoin utilization protein AcuC [Bacillaceae]KQL57457.1 histone deacetylase [Alkalicoccobacillus plakortidis]RQW21130.1 acetoin utilization protein AcuC [Bacillus sp. C1-1]